MHSNRMQYGLRFLGLLDYSSRLIPQVINQNLRETVAKYLRETHNKQQQPKAGDDEEELRKRYSKETVEKILQARREENIEQDEPIYLELLKQNIKIFHFFINHCQGLYVFAGFGEPVRFDWLVIFEKAKRLKLKLKPIDIVKLEVIENELMAFERNRNVYLS